jgi:Mg-chelatase subunit ChlD
MARDMRVELEQLSDVLESKGNLKRQSEEDKLMHSVLENDKNVIKNGKLISAAINQGFSSFTPDLMFDKLVKDYSIAENIYGEKLIRLLSGYEPSYIKKNIQIPEFQRELKQQIEKRIDELQDNKLISKDGAILNNGIKLASLILYTEELDNLIPRGILGEKTHKKDFIYGDKEDVKNYKKNNRYRDIAIKKSIKLALRRKHSKLDKKDLMVFQRQSKGSVYIIYGLDASGSMRGKKIETCKKAGIALAFKAIDEKDKVGLLVFGSEIKKEIPPTLDFAYLLHEITKVRASKETNITQTIKRAVELFPNEKVTKHLILLTDALPTIGKQPEEETLEAVSLARNSGITISIVGVSLDNKGKTFAEKIVQLGQGKLYVVKDLAELDKIVLEDYYSVL